MVGRARAGRAAGPPFDSLLEEARALDAADGRAGLRHRPRQVSVKKWSRFLKEAELNVSFEEWCLRFGHADLLAQWDEERNGSLKPSDVSRAILPECGGAASAAQLAAVREDEGVQRCRMPVLRQEADAGGLQ